MLTKLFRRLTGDSPGPADALFASITQVARRSGWYREGSIPDTIDGRFAVLASVAALVAVRLESLGPEGAGLSATLTGRFAEVMDSEHRQLGLGDPTLGKTVLKLVGSLARRVELWGSVDGANGWEATTKRSLPLDEAPISAVKFCAGELRRLDSTLRSRGIDKLAAGEIE